jgi:rare lipoprotein A (peptidoglycan hydrolase)
MKVFITFISVFLLWAGVCGAQEQNFIASWYNEPGKVMANGKFFDPNKYTGATRDFLLGSFVKLTAGKKSVVVKVTDRINRRYAWKRIDLTPAAFMALGAPLSQGLIDVRVERR